MTKTITYYYWLMSDWAYFGAERLEAIARRHGATVDHYPVRLPDVYARTGGILLGQRARQRQDYRFAELERWRRRLGIPLNLHPRYFPVDVDLASQMVYALKAEGRDPAAFSFAVLRALWAEDSDISDPATLALVADSLGLDGPALIERARQAPARDAYEAATLKAPDDGVFGSPFYLYRGEVFWGQDRLDFLEEALSA